MDPAYSIVIPAYNESARLGATLEKVLGYVHQQGWDAEVTKMIKTMGAPIDEADARAIKDYLTRNYGD